MSSQTPNLNLVLPVGTEHVSRQIINDNNTKIDTAVGANSTAIAKVQNGLSYIVGNTNATGGTLEVGQFVYVKGHSTIAEGLRTVTASISANGNITTSNTSACSDGGLNALNSKIANMTNVLSVTNSSALSEYPIGLNINRTGSTGGWPLNYAMLITFKIDSNYGVQFISNYQEKLQFRNSIDGTWGNWTVVK